MTRSIERVLLAWAMGALGLGAGLIVLVTYFVTLDEMNEIFDIDLKNVAEALGAHHRAGVGPGNPEVPRLPVRSDVPDEAEIVTVTWTVDGRRVFSSDPRVALPFRSEEALTRERVGSEPWIVYTDVSANGVAQAGQRLSGRRAAALESAAKIFLPVLGLMAVVAALLLFALRRGLQPLDRTALDVATRSAASLKPIATAEVPREIVPLVAAINGLMARLAQALGAQRRFLADAAHELRTPATALRLQLQLLQRSCDEASRAEAMRELQAGIERSQHLIEQLLQVARSEPDGEQLRLAPVELGALSRSVVAAMSAKADHLGIDLGAGGPGALAVAADAAQLTVLLNNLVENALRYTPRGGTVDVEALRLDGRPALRVVDSGPGIPEAERERVFARFYRGAAAPRQAADAAGTGLGLAIVRAIAERHGATVTLHTPAAGQGLEVRVRFAAAA